MNKNESINTKKPRYRSPSYPAIDLEAAIRKSRILKERGGAGDYFIAFEAAMKFLGYSPKSSNGWLILAALKKYELIEDKGTGKNREFRLSKLAQTILFYENSAPNSEEYKMAIKEAALNPPVHKELWNEYRDAPNDVLKPYLVLKRSEGTFTEKAADDCIEQYKKTISFTNLIKHDIISGHDEDKIPSQMEEKMNNAMPKDQPTSVLAMQASDTLQQTFNFPVKISDKLEANLTIQYPMEEKDLRDFLTALEALKPGILQSVLDKQNEQDEEN